MFGSLGYWASSKGMVAVPDLSGLTESQASTALSNAILSYSKIANTQTSDSNLVGKVAIQSATAGSLVDYESVIQISIYEYLCVPTWSGWYEIGSAYNFSACQPNNTLTYYIQERRDTSNCGSSYEIREVQKTTSCSYCSTQPNTVTREYEYFPYSVDCEWRYVYDVTRDGCGTFISRVFIGKGIICA